MEAMLTDKTYDASSCNQLSKTLADVIKQRVKELGHARYKIVSVVAIGQAQPSSVAFASRCVWNANFDSFAEYTYRNSSLYAIGLVYAVYCD
nr:hypothetical protein BaRGS_024813 [Batillaria attramentaria]